MAKDRKVRNSVAWRVCGAIALLAAFVGCGARAETVSRSARVTATASDEILDQVTVSRATTTARPRPDTPLTGNPLWGVALSSLQETRARPIFSPSRRPPSPPVVAAPRPPAPKPPPPQEPDRLKLTLLGTIIGASDSIGVFVDESSKEVIRIRAGSSYDGWTLHSVDRRRASFEKDHQETTLMFPPAGAEQPAPNVGAVSSRTGGAKISGNNRGAADAAENRTRPAALPLPVSSPVTPIPRKIRKEIRQDILSIGMQN